MPPAYGVTYAGGIRCRPPRKPVEVEQHGDIKPEITYNLETEIESADDSVCSAYTVRSGYLPLLRNDL